MARSRIFFVTDIHGSTRCFKKFLNAATFYNADVLILGGDVTGKVLTPIVDLGDGTFRCSYQGGDLILKNTQEVEDFRAKAADGGSYTQLVSPSEFKELEQIPTRVKQLFGELMVERMKEWILLAEQRLEKTPVKCFISPGNDDFFDLDPVLSSSSYVVNPEGRVVDIDGDHEMITLGFTNHTPWHSPREVDEEELAGRISSMAGRVRNMKSAIFNIHVPPIDTVIDQAPHVDESLKIVIKAGNVEMISAGSSACRNAIMKHQPLLGLHGHIHESKGIAKLGRTICANPGSEYGEGVLRGFLADIDGDGVKSYLFTSG